MPITLRHDTTKSNIIFPMQFHSLTKSCVFDRRKVTDKAMT